MSDGIEMASEDSDWSVSFPLPIRMAFKMTEVVTSGKEMMWLRFFSHSLGYVSGMKKNMRLLCGSGTASLVPINYSIKLYIKKTFSAD
jgi:hypothetical protein